MPVVIESYDDPICSIFTEMVERGLQLRKGELPARKIIELCRPPIHQVCTGGVTSVRETAAFGEMLPCLKCRPPQSLAVGSTSARHLTSV